ncbi:MAG TPA: hypothetical protein VKO83_12105, partial [Steroidobacteraceae bacterium]|nr:hypothetical protein [Steroidobacteraceae bacterium]
MKMRGNLLGVVQLRQDVDELEQRVTQAIIGDRTLQHPAVRGVETRRMRPRPFIKRAADCLDRG